MANGGTLFLDEISEVPLEIQVKLLCVLQERELERVGGNQTLKVDLHLIAASNRDLRERVTRGLFREDLFYRLNVVNIHVPALRDRPEDIPLLVNHFLDRFCQQMRKTPKHLSLPLHSRCSSPIPWPGNVRELRQKTYWSGPLFSATRKNSMCSPKPPYHLPPIPR